MFIGKSKWCWLVALAVIGCSGSNGAAAGRGSAYPDEEVEAARPERAAAERQLAAGSRLERRALVRAVLARNPDVDAARHAYRASRARVAQADALPDPMLMYEFAPLSIGSNKVPYGQTIRLSQSFPWPGKLAGRERSAQAMADSMREEIEVTKLELALEACELHDDYWLVERGLEVNRAHQKLLRELGASARAQYEVGRGSLQDPLQAEVEITHLEHQDLMLKAERSALVARLNALLHREPEAKLPGPPDELEISEQEPPPSKKLQEQALAQRGELRAASARIRAAQSMIQVAGREYYPDLTLSGTYSSMFMDIEHQFMVGIEFPIPLARASRGGAVDEASAEAAGARSGVAREIDAIRREVDVARLRVVEAIHIVHLYRARLIPVARQQIAAARSAYQTGASDFQALISAERNLREVELAHYVAQAELSKRRAQLERTLGQMPGLGGER
jgi:outer membrane protein, heavy metal efflux system